MHIQSNQTHPGHWEKIISLPTKPPAPDHIGYVFKSLLIYEWYESRFPNHEKMAIDTTFSAPFLRSLLPPNTKILRPRISFRVKTTDFGNQYDLYSITCVDESSIFEGVDFTELYVHSPLDS